MNHKSAVRKCTDETPHCNDSNWNVRQIYDHTDPLAPEAPRTDDVVGQACIEHENKLKLQLRSVIKALMPYDELVKGVE